MIKEVFPYLRVNDCAKAIAFYETVFGAKETFRIQEKSGRIGHVELIFAKGFTVMCSDEYPEADILGPGQDGTGQAIHLHVDDADAYVERAVKHGATIIRPVSDAPHGERGGTVRDPFGHDWTIGHTYKQMTPDEMKRAYAALED